MELKNFVKVVEQSIKDNWNEPALSDYKRKTLTYGDVGKEIIKYHQLFRTCVKPGDKIALLSKNSVNWTLTYLSAITYGATIVPILPDFHKSDITNIINHSDSVLLFIGDHLLDKLEIGKYNNIYAIINNDNHSVIYEDKHFEFSNTLKGLDYYISVKYQPALKPKDILFAYIDNTHIGVISYTSGTTGFSKGVMLSLTSLMANVEFAQNNMSIERGDSVLSILPLAHAYGCSFEFLWPFSKGVHITFLGKTISPQLMMEAFKIVKPKVILMVPLIIEKIYKKKLLPILNKPSMKVLLKIPLVNKLIYRKFHLELTNVFGGNFNEVIIGGAALNKEVELFLRRIKFNFSVGYGMTECGPLISYASWNQTHLGSCGRLVNRLQLQIDSPDPENIPGEIMVRGQHLMNGYYKNNEATTKAIDENGWLHTGDLGIKDKNNFIYIMGRSKSLILGASGENIYPEEIEAKLNNLPLVQEQVVVEKNKKIIAFVYPDLAEVEKQGISKEQLVKVMEDNRKILNENLPKYSQVSEILIHETEFEKTPKQSIKRFIYAQ